MRLTPEQARIIRQAAQQAFGPDTDTWLFGSRVDDHKRGGDIDLLLRPQLSDRVIARKLNLLRLLERQLGERKIDILIEMPDDTRPIVRLAHETGMLL
jgi:predicted nucleotidyltransferase